MHWKLPNMGKRTDNLNGGKVEEWGKKMLVNPMFFLAPVFWGSGKFILALT